MTTVIGAPVNNSKNYWSSTERNAGGARPEAFYARGLEDTAYLLKNYSYEVRAVRAF